MIKTIEDSRAEFKVKLVDDLEESVIAFLNKDGGNIYIGVNDNGNVVGLKNNIDLLQRKVKDKIISGVEPSVLGLFDLENDSLLINNDHSNEANNAYKLVCSIPIQLLNSISFYIEEINEKTDEKDLSIAYRKYLERIAIVSYATAISYLLKKWCDIQIVDDKLRYGFNNNIILNGYFNYCETFKLEFDNKNKIISIENIKYN